MDNNFSDGKIMRREQLKKLLMITKEEGKVKKSHFYNLKASHERVKIIAKYFRMAYREDSTVVFRSVIMPTEIFFAFGFIPVCVENVCAMLAISNLAQRALNVADGNYYSRDICSFSRCTLGAAIENYLPTPDFLACTSYYCEDTTKLFYTLSKLYKKKYFLFDIPYDYKNEESVSYVAYHLKEMVKSIECQQNIKLDPKRLKEAIIFSNDARKYFVKINELRRNIPSPISGGEAIDYAAMLAFTWGAEEMVDLCKLFYEELLEKINKNRENSSPVNNKKPRILWRHLRPYYNNDLIDFVENQCGAEVAFEEINYIHWEEMDPTAPYRSLAKKILSNPPIGDFEHWLGATHNFIEWYKIDGVISFQHWGCRQLCGGGGLLKKTLEKKNIPFLEIGGDCIDNRDYSFAQIKIRVEAFLEIIRRRSK